MLQCWIFEDDMQGLVNDAFHRFGDDTLTDDMGTQTESMSMPNLKAKKFYKVLGEAKKPLYHRCKLSVLSFIIRLFHGKCVGKCSDNGFGKMLDTMREAFPMLLYQSHCMN